MSKLVVNLLDTASCTAALSIIQAQMGGSVLAAPAAVETPAAIENNAQISTNPENRAPVEETAPAADDLDASKPDSAGNMWNGEFHVSPPKQNKDKTWRVSPGKAEAFKAFLDGAANTAPAETADNAPAPEHTAPGAMAQQAMGGMPGMGAGMPGIGGTDTPPVAPSYDELCTRFIEMNNAGKIADPMALYASAGVTDPNALMTNDTLRAALWAKLDEIG